MDFDSIIRNLRRVAEGHSAEAERDFRRLLAGISTGNLELTLAARYADVEDSSGVAWNTAV